MSSQKPHYGRKMAGIFLLAFLCIGTVELAVCKFEEPKLFEKITDPIIAFLGNTTENGKQWMKEIIQTYSKTEPIERISVAAEIDTEANNPNITKFIQRENYELLTGGTIDIIYYNQEEEPWASCLFGSDPMSDYGCGPTVLAMIVSTFTSQKTTPAEMAVWAEQQGYYAPGNGSYLSIVEGAATAYELNISSWKIETTEDLCRELAGGNIFVALMTKGHFTEKGHFIILRGITPDKKILIADPKSREHSLESWEPQIIIDELSTSEYAGAPLWKLSTNKFQK